MTLGGNRNIHFTKKAFYSSNSFVKMEHGYSTQLFPSCQAAENCVSLFFWRCQLRHIFSYLLHRMIGSHIAKGGEHMSKDIDEMIFGDEEYTVSQR